MKPGERERAVPVSELGIHRRPYLSGFTTKPKGNLRHADLKPHGLLNPHDQTAIQHILRRSSSLFLIKGISFLL